MGDENYYVGTGEIEWNIPTCIYKANKCLQCDAVIFKCAMYVKIFPCFMDLG